MMIPKHSFSDLGGERFLIAFSLPNYISTYQHAQKKKESDHI